MLLSHVFDRSRVSNANRPRLLADALAQTRILVFEREFDRIFDRAFSLFIDLFTLKERIEKHSLAFEGIRLVKERVI